MVQVDETQITINCSCNDPFYRLYIGYNEGDEENTLDIAVLVYPRSFWERLKAAYVILTAGEARLSELGINKHGAEVLRQFLNRTRRQNTTVISYTSNINYGGNSSTVNNQ